MNPFFTQTSASMNYHCKTYPIMSSHVLISSVKFDLVPLWICRSRWHHHSIRITCPVLSKEQTVPVSLSPGHQVKSRHCGGQTSDPVLFFNFILLLFINRYSIPSLSLLFVKCRLYVVSDGWSLAMRPMAHFCPCVVESAICFILFNRGSLAIGKMEDFL